MRARTLLGALLHCSPTPGYPDGVAARLLDSLHLRSPRAQISRPAERMSESGGHCLDIAMQHAHRKVLQIGGTRTCRTSRTMCRLVFLDVAFQTPASRILTSMHISPT